MIRNDIKMISKSVEIEKVRERTEIMKSIG